MLPNKDSYQYKKQWFSKATIGALLIGVGVVMVAWSSILKYEGVAALEWFTYGTVSMIIFMSGVSFFGDAIKDRIYYEIRSEKEQAKQKVKRLQKELESSNKEE